MSTSTNTFRPKVGVAGAGRGGIAFAHHLARRGHDVVLLTSIPQRAAALETKRRLKSIVPELDKLDGLDPRVTITTDPAQVAEECSFILFTVSDAYFRKILDPLGEHLDGAHRVVHALHSLHGRQLCRTSEVIEEVTCVKQVGVLSGPIHVSELLAGKPNAAIVASDFPALAREAEELLSSENFLVYGSNDIRGVELAAALYQVVTLAIGIADGLDMGAATHAALATAGLAEIAQLGGRLGGNERTFFGLTGLGQLIDAIRRGEPNYELGLALARADDVATAVAEAPPEAKSVEIVRQLTAWGEERGVTFRTAIALSDIFDGARAQEDVLREIMRDRSYFSSTAV